MPHEAAHAGWPPDREGVSASDIAMLRQLLFQRAGIQLDAGKEYFIELRLAALAVEEGLGSANDLLETLHTEEAWGPLHRRIVECLAIAETSWFRDRHPFETLRHEVLPALIAARAGERRLRLWSAGCASGQEPYSLAMMLEECESAIAGWDARILATDFSLTQLKRAREGAYSQIEMNRGLPAPLLVRHFRKDDGEWRLRDDARARVEFRELNLNAPWPALPLMDVILMRNVLLYFGDAARRAILRQVRSQLRPDGVLLLGGGETALPLAGLFDTVTLGRTVLHRPRPALEESPR